MTWGPEHSELLANQIAKTATEVLESWLPQELWPALVQAGMLDEALRLARRQPSEKRPLDLLCIAEQLRPTDEEQANALVEEALVSPVLRWPTPLLWALVEALSWVRPAQQKKVVGYLQSQDEPRRFISLCAAATQVAVEGFESPLTIEAPGPSESVALAYLCAHRGYSDRARALLEHAEQQNRPTTYDELLSPIRSHAWILLGQPDKGLSTLGKPRALARALRAVDRSEFDVGAFVSALKTPLERHYQHAALGPLGSSPDWKALDWHERVLCLAVAARAEKHAEDARDHIVSIFEQLKANVLCFDPPAGWRQAILCALSDRLWDFDPPLAKRLCEEARAITHHKYEVLTSDYLRLLATRFGLEHALAEADAHSDRALDRCYVLFDLLQCFGAHPVKTSLVEALHQRMRTYRPSLGKQRWQFDLPLAHALLAEGRIQDALQLAFELLDQVEYNDANCFEISALLLRAEEREEALLLAQRCHPSTPWSRDLHPDISWIDALLSEGENDAAAHHLDSILETASRREGDVTRELRDLAKVLHRFEFEGLDRVLGALDQVGPWYSVSSQDPTSPYFSWYALRDALEFWCAIDRPERARALIEGWDTPYRPRAEREFLRCTFGSKVPSAQLTALLGGAEDLAALFRLLDQVLARCSIPTKTVHDIAQAYLRSLATYSELSIGEFCRGPQP